MSLKKSWPYVFISIACLCAYAFSKSVLKKEIVEKQITYSSDVASEVYMAWGLTSGDSVPGKFRPPDSFIEDGMVFSRMNRQNKQFFTSMRLPAYSEVYYYMVQKKDTAGNVTEVWDTGRDDKVYFRLNFINEGFFKPGYFIFLAGFLPLLLMYNKYRKVQLVKVSGIYRIKDYIPQFDSIRAIAVLLVIVHHWLGKYKFLNFIPNGQLGVNIFFVLSGFLITGILLRSKKEIEAKEMKKRSAFKTFYIRRTLRIFPIYYILLFILWLLNDPSILKEGIYYFTYTSNILFYSEQFFPNRLSHLWSLAVEEQFYILWPWLIILVRHRVLPYLIAAFIIGGIASNYIFIAHGYWGEILTPACFDAFAIGGLLSYLSVYRQDIIEKLQPAFRWIFLLITILFVIDVLEYPFLPRRTSHALLATAIIYYCLFRKNNRAVNFILDNKWLMRLGKISYGVYLYHLFVPELWLWINHKFNAWNIDFFFNKKMPDSLKPAWIFLQEFAFLLLLCTLSWKLIEKPCNSLKKKFETKPKKLLEVQAAPDNSFSY